MQSPEEEKLIQNNEAPESYSASVSQYNPGPRKATDKWFGVIFVLFIVTFIGWSGAGIGSIDCGHNNNVFVWDFAPSQWELKDGACSRLPGTCGVRATPSPTTPAPSVHVTTAEADVLATLIVTPIMVAFIGGFFLGFLLVIGFKYQPYFMVYLACFVQILTPAALGIYLIHLNGELAQTDAGTQNSDGSQAFTYPAYCLFFISAVLAIVYYLYRESLKLCAEMFKFSAIGIQHNLCLLPVQGIFFLLACLFKIALLALFVFSICAVQVVPEADDDFGVFQCTTQVNNNRHAYYVFFSIAFGWFAFWALETRNYIVADVMAHWYWHGNEGADIARGTKNAFCSHFGSMAFAGLATWFIERLKRATRTRPSNPIGCIIVLIARCILSYIEYLFKMAVIMVAITGQSFGNSGVAVGRLFWKSFGNLYHSSGVWIFPGRILRTLNFLLAAALGAAYGGAAYNPTLKDCQDGKFSEFMQCDENSPDNADGDCITCGNFATFYAVIAGFAIFFIVLFLLSLFSGILLVILDTTFLCFLLDKDAGVVTKPQFHRIFGTVLEHRNKSIKTPAVAPRQPAYIGDVSGQVCPVYSRDSNGFTTMVPPANPPAYAQAPGAMSYGTSPSPPSPYSQQPQQYGQPQYGHTQQQYGQPAYSPTFNAGHPGTAGAYEDTLPGDARFDPNTGQPISKN